MMNKKPMTIQKKTGVFASMITLVVVACLVLLNVAVGVITEKYPTKIDLTSEKAFGLSQQSIDYLSAIGEPVEITLFNTKDNFSSGGVYFTQAMAVIEQYAKYSGQIKIHYVDLLANPSYATQYADAELAVNDILVQSGDKTQKLTVYDIFNIENSWYGGSITSSKAEQELTSAIINVTDKNKVKIAFITGHEESGDEVMEESLQKNGFETVRASLLTEGVPQDAQVAILCAPQRDITAEEVAALDRFLENEGSYGRQVLYFASAQQQALPNLEQWLAKWGIAVQSGLVAETDIGRVINQSGFYAMADIDDATLTEKMTTANVPLLMPVTRPVQTLFESNLGYTTKSLLSYSASAGLVSADVQRVEDIVVSGPISVAAMSTYQKDGKESAVLVYGSQLIMDGNFFESGSLSNADYMLSVMNSLTKRENAVSIAPKALGGGYIAISGGEVLLWSLFFIAAFPLIVLCVGLRIWSRRRRR